MSSYRTDNVAKNALTDMGINFVSLCGRGIHAGATVELFKSADGPLPDVPHPEPRKLKDIKRDKLRRHLMDTRREGVKAHAPEEDDDDSPTDVNGVRRKLRSMKERDAEEKSPTVKKTARTLSSVPTTPKPGEANMADTFTLPDGLPTDVVEYIGKLEDEIIYKGDDEDEEVEDEETEDDGVEKSLEAILAKSDLDPDVKSFLAKQAERVNTAEALAKAHAETSIRKAVRDKAGTYVGFGKSAGDIAETLYELRKADPALAAEVEDLLDHASAAVNESGLFEEVGKGGANTADGQIEGIAKGHMVADPSLTPEQAFAKAFEENPQLYTDYLNEKGA